MINWSLSQAHHVLSRVDKIAFCLVEGFCVHSDFLYLDMAGLVESGKRRFVSC